LYILKTTLLDPTKSDFKFKMPSLLATATLAALAAGRPDSQRRLVADLSMTPCTHTICGARRLENLPTYTASSKIPKTAHNGGFTEDNVVVIQLDPTAYAIAGSNGQGSITREGTNIKFAVTLDDNYYDSQDCKLGVIVSHVKGASDRTLQMDANVYVANDTELGAYTGNSTIAAPDEVPFTLANSRLATVVVPYSSYPYRYESTDGKKLHTGRLGITAQPYIRCDGFSSNVASSTKMFLKELDSNSANSEYAFFYDLVADGSTLFSKDKAGTPVGSLIPGGLAKREFRYSAAFQHFHDQVRFPDPSVDQPSVDAGRTPADHFHGLPTPKAATCEWDSESGTFVSGIQSSILIERGWMSVSDSAVPTQEYAEWAADLCTADAAALDYGICKKYARDASVVSDNAYLPFDKPLAKYYAIAPKIKCQSQGSNPVGTMVESEIVPDITSDSAASIVSNVKIGFHTVTNVDCGTRDGASGDICKTDTDQLTVQGTIFDFQVNTSNFDDLLADTFNFAATYSCLSDRADGADPCSITNGAQTNPQTLASLSRGTDATNDLVYQLNAKATAVQDITFNVPNLYGTTFSGFKATISNEPLVDTNPQKYRATGNFNVLMLAADDKIEWRGGPESTTKDFDGFTTTDRFKTRNASILTKTRVKAAALATDGTGYYTPNALFTDVSGVGTMSPFRDVGDLADSADADEQTNLDGTNDATALALGEMSPSNQFYAVKSFCCGQDDAVTVGQASINCKLSRKNGLAAADPAASTYCRTNGFKAVRCLSSVLDVKYTVTTDSLDDRYSDDTKIAVKTYTNDAIASLSQAHQVFAVDNAAYAAVTVGAGGQAGTSERAYSVDTAFMGTASATFARTTTGEDKTYNCESAGRTIDYSVSVATPCGESDRGEQDPYLLEAVVEAHYVYTKGTSGKGTDDQVSQTTATGSLGGDTKHNGAIAYETNSNWETTEWRVQDSSKPGSAAKGSETPIRLKVVIANDDAGANTGLHLPASKVHIRNDTTLKVKAGDGSVTLEDCYDDEAGARYCVLLYTNDLIMSVSAGKYCGTTNSGVAEPDCPEIEYTIAAKVKNGGDSLDIDAFGQDAACGAVAATEWTQIGGPRSHTLKVLGNNRAYDGVIDIHAAESDPNCDAMCTNEGYDPETYTFDGSVTSCSESTFTPPASDTGFLQPDGNAVNTYCLNPRPMAEESLHDVAVPGKDGAATTILDQGSALASGKILTSKDLTFKVTYFQIGTGPRAFIIKGLGLPSGMNLPAPLLCSSTQYNSELGCVDTAVQSTSVEFKTDVTCGGGELDSAECRGEFYLALGNDKDIDVCAQTNVGNDPYTDSVTKELSLGFSIQVNYESNGFGDPDTGVPHNFYFKLQCPQKDYSLNLVQAAPSANRVDKSIQVNQDIGLVNKNLYADSHVNFMTMHTYFAGRSTERYKTVSGTKSLCIDTDLNDADTVCHKAAIRLEQPSGIDNVQFKDAVSEIFLDDADTFETRQELELEFKTPCLFTTVTFVSKSTPIIGGVFDTTTGTDVRFTFRVQCPRWQQTVSSDSLKLEYDVKATAFDVTGGSVTVQQPALSQNGMVNDFASITTSLKGKLCDDETAVDVCKFPDVGAGNLSTLSKQGEGETQQSWLDYLQKDCKFERDSGDFVGFMERQYTRADLAGGGSQDYCSGRKLSFGVRTSGQHTASIRVSSPIEMEFAVQIQNLEWKQDLCNASNNEWYMKAEASLYRREVEGSWSAASASTFTDFTFVKNFFGTPTKTISGETLTITGGCQKLETNGEGIETNCVDFETEREVDFGALYSLYGVDYRAQMGIDFSMTCPRGQLDGSTSGGIALRHLSDCSAYGESSLQTCNVTGNVAEVNADGQIQLTLIIDDTAFTDHVVSKPTYVQKDGNTVISSGLVEDLCLANQADCVYRANDGSIDIPLVGSRAYPTEMVTIGNQDWDWSGRPNEENSVVTLRALPLSGTTVDITWVVDRVLQNSNSSGTRRLRATYTLGADDTGADALSFRVIPATREEESGIAASGAESAAEGAEANLRTFVTTTPSSEEEKKDDDSTISMTILWVSIGTVVGVLVIGLIVSKILTPSQKGAVKDSEDSTTTNRFYQYSRLDKAEHARSSRFLF